MKVLVTGGSGLAGSYIVAELQSHGYEVVIADIATPAGARRGATGPGEAAFIRTDSTDFGQVVAVMKGVDAVIHMAAIPNPLGAPEHEVFRVNMASDWNVLEAAEIHGIRKVVKASSINAVGAVFSKRRVAPLYFPIDEEHPTRAEDSYSQSKWLGRRDGRWVLPAAGNADRFDAISRLDGRIAAGRPSRERRHDDRGRPDSERVLGLDRYRRSRDRLPACAGI